jgi:hypothetical protein
VTLLALTLDVNLHGGGTSAWVPVLTAALAGAAGLAGAKLGAKATLDSAREQWTREQAIRDAERDVRNRQAAKLVIGELRIYLTIIFAIETQGVKGGLLLTAAHEGVGQKIWDEYEPTIALLDGGVWSRCSTAYDRSRRLMLGINPSGHPGSKLIEGVIKYEDGAHPNDTVTKSLAKTVEADIQAAVKALAPFAGLTEKQALGTKQYPVPEPTGNDGKQPETIAGNDAPEPESSSG